MRLAAECILPNGRPVQPSSHGLIDPLATAILTVAALPRVGWERVKGGLTRLNERRVVGRMHATEVVMGSAAGRAFAQERLSLFSLLMLGLSLGGYVMTNVVTYGIPSDPHVLLSDTNLAHLGASLVFLVMWLLARGAPIGDLALAALDLAGIVGALALFDLMSVTISVELRPDLASRHLVMLLVTTNVLVARSVLVPSHPRFTLLVGVAAAIPALFFAAVTDGPGEPTGRVAYAFTWVALITITSTFVSRVIYGLREKVREAHQLGQYTLGERLGEGGMGVVYRAEHAMLRRPTAVKLLDANEVGERALQRFEKEVQLTSQLTHPSTIAIYDYGRTPDGVFYYAMELVDGLDLRALVERHGPQPPERVVALVRQACGSLAEAHRRGLVHRDVKPENMIVTHRPGQGDVLKVLDFGLVKDVSDRSLSQTGAVLGTPLFLSPEAIEAPERVGPASDLYALGCVMYYLLTGEHVFDAKSVIELCAAHVAKAPVPPSERTEAPIPKKLEEIVMRCLEKDPSSRFESAEALADALAEALDDAWTTSHAEAWWKKSEARTA